MEYLEEIMSNKILWVSVLSWAVAQMIKIFIDIFKHKRMNLALIVSSGGMPSSHTSFVAALSTRVGMVEGFDSPIFAVCAIVSLVVMYDAQGVRRAAGRQAEIINILVENIENTGIILDKKLKELLGHSPIEVAAGALLGLLIALLV